MLPVALLYQIFFGNGAEMVLHLVGALGFLLISLSVFDFKISKWINLAGFLASTLLAFVFLLQGISDLIQNDSLTYFAFQILGQRLESALVGLLILWFVLMLLFDSQGKSRIFGLVVMSIIVGLEVISLILAFRNTSLNEEVPASKLLFLLMFIWFLFECKKAQPKTTDSRILK